MNLLATSYPLLDAFLTMLWFFGFVIWIWILVWIMIDIFRSHDISGWMKALWFIFILFLPLFGVLVYLIARGSGMHERSVQQARQQEKAFREYVQQTAGSQSAADELTKLKGLRDQGVISEDEYQAQKGKLLA
jgi:ABC-type multidrug transport system fused ATPase/permease subunit